MRARSMVLIFIALGCGLVASIGISQVLERDKKTEVTTEKIFVAIKDIDIGEKLGAQSVKLEQWPRERLPEGAVMRLEDVDGKFPRTRLFIGEPILKSKLMNTRENNSDKVPAGYRVVSASVSIESGPSALIQPGDRVDLIGFFSKSNDIPTTTTKTILRDVRVFAVDTETERKAEKQGNAPNVRTVSFLVKHAQVEKLTLAIELGKLRLSLRRPDDESTEGSDEGAGVDELFGKTELATERRPAAPASEKPSFLDWLDKQTPNKPIEPATNATVPVMETTIVYTPDGATTYQFAKGTNGPPTVMNAPGVAPTTTPPAEADADPKSGAIDKSHDS